VNALGYAIIIMTLGLIGLCVAIAIMALSAAGLS